MAILSLNQCLKLIKEPKNSREIVRAREKRIRTKLHTEPETETNSIFLSEPHFRFLQWVGAVLQSSENYERFRQLYRPPVPTNELTESIFSEFEKVFEGQNRYEKFEFTDSETEINANLYRKAIGDFSFWPTQGFETFKTSIDNLLVIDLPQLAKTPEGDFIQESDAPEPYYYILDISNLIDVENVKVKGTDTLTGQQFYYFKTEYVIFCGLDSKTNEELIYVYDDIFYRRFRKTDAGAVFIDETAHELGFCPARSFWTTPLNSKSTIQKRNPITNSLSDLDWLLFFAIAERYLQLYAPFPIYAVYKTKCDWKQTGEVKAKCVDGYQVFDGIPIDPNNRKRCPQCGHKVRVGPGNIMFIAPPREGADPDQMTNPMKVIPAERESLDYMKEAIADLKKEIYSSCVGKSTDINIKQAQNEKQVDAGYESQQSVILKVKRNYEIIHLFALDTTFRLRYKDKYIGGVMNYGDVFFNKDESAEVEELKAATEIGAPSYEISMRRDAINTARYRNKPDAIERIKVLRNLDPFPDMDLKGITEMRKEVPEMVSDEDMVIKMKFNAFIDRFEREQTSVLLFGRALDFGKKIDQIREQLKTYAKEYLIEATPKKDSAPDPVPPGPIPPVPIPA